MAYADIADLETYLAQSAPDAPSEAVATRMLARASELIDDHIRTAIYPHDTDGLPTESVHQDALRDAVCAQVEFWFAGDEEDDVLGPVKDISFGTVKATPADVLTLAPRAARILRNADLYQSQPRIL